MGADGERCCSECPRGGTGHGAGRAPRLLTPRRSLAILSGLEGDRRGVRSSVKCLPPPRVVSPGPGVRTRERASERENGRMREAGWGGRWEVRSEVRRPRASHLAAGAYG